MLTGIILMSRIPRPGVTKTRLEVCFTPEQCAAFHQACLTDELRELNQLTGPKFFCYTGELDAGSQTSSPRLEAACGLAAGILEGWIILKQQGHDLGERMRNAARVVLETTDAVVIIGSDMPWLTKERIIEAATLLETQDVVLGPAADGGYYLIGLKRVEECLFTGIPWSTDRVFQYTQAIIMDNNLSAGLLAVEHDLDTPTDLDQFWRQAQEQPHREQLASYQYLKQLRAGEKVI